MALIKHFPALVCSAFLLLTSPGAVNALTVIDRDFDGLVARADTVFKGTVTNKSAAWTGEGSTRHIVTFVTFQVEETYKGAPAAEQTLRFLGGTVGDDTLAVPDMPAFEAGQKAVLFVVGNGKQFCPLVGVAQGRFHVVRDEATGRERILTNDGYPVVSTTEIGQRDATGRPRLQRYAHTDARAMTTEDFRSEILGKVARLPH